MRYVVQAEEKEIANQKWPFSVKIEVVPRRSPGIRQKTDNQNI
jgi:hypothetical protein